MKNKNSSMEWALALLVGLIGSMAIKWVEVFLRLVNIGPQDPLVQSFGVYTLLFAVIISISLTIILMLLIHSPSVGIFVPGAYYLIKETYNLIAGSYGMQAYTAGIVESFVIGLPVGILTYIMMVFIFKRLGWKRK